MLILWAIWAMSLPAAAGLVVHVAMFIDNRPPLVYGPFGLTHGEKRSYRAMWR